MAKVITVQELQDASVDAQTLEDVINGEPDKQYKSRLGRYIWTLATINSKIEYVRAQANSAVQLINESRDNVQSLLESKINELNDAINAALAAGAGANGWTSSLIQDESGINQQQINARFTIPEMFGAKANNPSFDNTNALNNAFATGKTIYGNPNDTYYVSGILETKGQQLVGGWKISSSRHGLGTVATNNHTPSTDDFIRMLYLESAYDLVELLHIKALGFNMINHYGYFNNIGHDSNGSFDKLLNNCMTAGLKVNVGTESDEAKASLDNFIKKYQGHPNVWGFASWDEGVQRGFTVADQDNRIATIKNYTKKPVTIVDFVSNPFKQVFSTNYDYVFVNSYSGVHSDLTDLGLKLKRDLSNMRLHYGCVRGMTRCNNIVPTLGLFGYKPEANVYSGDVDQIILAAREFVKSGNGNYAVFVWDGSGDISITANVRNNQKLKDFSLEIAQFNSKQPKYETDVLLFGGSNTDTLFPITDLFTKLPVLDKNTSDPNVASNMYPMIIKPSENGVETQRYHLVNNQTYSGLGMKGDYCSIMLNQKVRKHIRAKLDYAHLLSSLSGYLEVLSTGDNGYTPVQLFVDGFSGNKLFDFLTNPPNENHDLIIRMYFTGDTASADKYRKFLRGLIVCSDW